MNLVLDITDLTFPLYILMLKTINKKNAIKALMVSGIATPFGRIIAHPTQPMRLIMPTKKVKMPNFLFDTFKAK